MASKHYRDRVRARKDASESEPTSDGASDTDDRPLENQDEASSDSGPDSTQEQSDSESSDEPPDKEAASISFGALVKAQEALGKRKRGNEEEEGKEGENAHQNFSQPNAKYINSEALERKAGKKDTRDFTRASKHAPTELSSKKAVSRKRAVVPTHKLDHRDPRFEPLSGPVDTEKTNKVYAFLDQYRDSEIADLKTSIRQTKDPVAKEQLKRALVSMESRKQTQQRKEQEQEVLRQHRKEEQAEVERGKKPFYLKKTERKQLALVKRFEGMGKKQVDRVIERRRKKQAGKEKKTMPEIRRG